MAEEQCPYCGSDLIHTEAALQSPKSATIIGRWRIGCGYTMFALVLLVGVTSLIFRGLWLDGALAVPGMWIAVAAFLFAGFLLIVTVNAARWDPMTRHICQACGLSWLTENDPEQESGDAPGAPSQGATG